MRDPGLHPDSRRALSSGGKCWAGQKRIPVGGGQSCALNDKSVEGETPTIYVLLLTRQGSEDKEACSQGSRFRLPPSSNALGHTQQPFVSASLRTGGPLRSAAQLWNS